MKEITDSLYCIKIKNFCFSNDTVKKMRSQDTDWEEIFEKDIW